MTDKPEASAARGWFWSQHAPMALMLILATIAVDQLHKWWMIFVYDIEGKGRVTVTPFLDLIYVKNIGISYSLFNQESAAGQWLLAGFAVLASAGLWLWLNRSGGGRLMAAGLALIIGGAIGNAIDRLHLGGVADFFSMHAFGYHWYVFNIADVAIVAGVAALLYESFRGESH
ncbi:signal peptidase II [Hyphomicrobium methylovorum]|uniref:signal peptidase II n=1 Tax=Hyphomicrobium methylovorum TaxID=84 RepID=UPI0015E6DEC0|nr:signal peptidase II [Hyphomicrobium methylovorum]MBA2126841.1 signal peptidase II [Hyphomicrobium methylovorum]